MDEHEKKQELKKRKYIAMMVTEMEHKGLSDKTIRKHFQNVELYVEFLNFHHDADIEHGVEYTYLADFFGYYFIRKCMWSTPATLKSTAASIKKFYKCMAEHQVIDEESYKEFLSIMKDFVPEWMEECDDYNNGNATYF